MYDETRQMSVDGAGEPVVVYMPREIGTFAERDEDRPTEPRTGTKANRDTDVDGWAAGDPIVHADTMTRAARDSDDPSPSTVTKAGLDPGDVDVWVAGQASTPVDTGTRGGRVADDPDPRTGTAAGRDPGDVDGWVTRLGAAPFGGQKSDDPVTGVVAF